MYRLVLVSFLLCTALPLAAVPAAAQAAPDTDVFLMEMPQLTHELRAGPVENVTKRAGYDNQPVFSPSGALLYTSQRDGQTDLFRFDPGSGAHQRITATPVSEYSPTPAPDGRSLSAVVVEPDGTQRLWRYSLDGMASTPVFEAIKPVGYHAWADAHTVALFVLGDPPVLVLADTRTGRGDTLARNIGRALHKVPGQHAVSYVHKGSDTEWTIMRYHLDTGVRTPLVHTLPGREDYAWTPDGDLLMADGARLYAFTFDHDGWELLADLSASGVTDITRLAVSPRGDLLAFVATPVP